MSFPILMKPYLKDAIWAGNKLITEYGKGEGISLAESWELSNYKGAESFAACGEFCGKPFSELHEMFSPNKEAVLIKFIDSAKALSVQVHPSTEDGDAKPKNECWYVASAEPGATIAYGLKEEYTKEEIRAAALDGTLDKYLNIVEVKPGDFFYVPAGLIHAVGAGITVVEIQQTSDTTYRLFDYGRFDASGNPRELHLDKAINSYRHFEAEEISSLRFADYNDFAKPGCLAASPYFSVYKLKGKSSTFDYTKNEAALIFLTDGEISFKDSKILTRKGETYYIPPMCDCTVKSDDAILAAF